MIFSEQIFAHNITSGIQGNEYRKEQIFIKYDINLINSMKFDKTPEEEYSSSYELTAKQVESLPRSDEDLNELRNMLADIFTEKLRESYAQLESKCDISADSNRFSHCRY